MTYDVTLGPSPTKDGLPPVAHAVDCPEVRGQADAGEPVMTMYGCTEPLPDDVIRHECMDRQ